MPSIVSFLTTLLLVIAFAESRPTSLLKRLPQPPGSDPFYTPPTGYQSSAPGTVLRSRNVTAAFFGILPDPVQAYQLLYRTTAVNGSAIATVTTVFKPLGAATDRFVSFATAEDSAASSCAPSYGYQFGANQTDLISTAEFFVIQAYIYSGYIVSSPDYEGPDSAFSAGRLEGMGVLDSMRAVQSFSPLALTNKPKIVGVGYSGGAIATGWAAGLQPNYAPELNIAGWVGGGTSANLTGTFVYNDGQLFSGFLPIAIVGQSTPSAYPQLQTLINQVATPAGKAALQYSATHCAQDVIVQYPFTKVASTTFTTLGAGLLYDPQVASVLDDNLMGRNKNETPTAPVFLYHALQDEIIPYGNASQLVETWCADGASVKFTTFGNGGHLTTEIVGLPDALNFVKSAFAGTTTTGCSQNTELSSILNPIALGVELEPILTKLITILYTLGTGDSNLKQNLGLLKSNPL